MLPEQFEDDQESHPTLLIKGLGMHTNVSSHETAIGEYCCRRRFFLDRQVFIDFGIQPYIETIFECMLPDYSSQDETTAELFILLTLQNLEVYRLTPAPSLISTPDGKATLGVGPNLAKYSPQELIIFPKANRIQQPFSSEKAKIFVGPLEANENERRKEKEKKLREEGM
ncbi:hypothetical protein ACTXT7_001657 [Hymenolepis weldensis]